MPFITVTTNLSENQLPLNFMQSLSDVVANTLGRDPRLICWTFDTGKAMSMVI